MLTIQYVHKDCPVDPGVEWFDEWDCACDSDCPACGAAIEALAWGDYSSRDDAELDPEIAAQYRKDRLLDDIPTPDEARQLPARNELERESGRRGNE